MHVADPLLDMAKRLEEAALRDSYFVERKLYPNVDFYSGIIMRAIGIPLEMFTVIFAIGRMPGWIANFKEVMEDGQTRIYRPRQIYTRPNLEPLLADQRPEIKSGDLLKATIPRASGDRKHRCVAVIRVKRETASGFNEYSRISSETVVGTIWRRCPCGRCLPDPGTSQKDCRGPDCKRGEADCRQIPGFMPGAGEKAHSKSGYQGGVKICKTADDVYEKAKAMLGRCW